MQIVWRKLDCSCSDVLVQARQLGRARDRNNPRLLSQQPGECYLSGSRLLPFGELAKQVNKGPVRLPSLWRKARNDVAEVGTVERSVFVDLARQEALAQGAIGNEPNSKFLDRRQHFLLRISEPERVFTLDRGHRLDGVSPPNRLCSSFRKAEVLHLTFPNQVPHRSRHILDRHVRVNTVLIEKIDNVGLESPERGFGDFLDVLRPTIQDRPPLPTVGIRREAEFRCYHYLIAT